MFNSGMNFELTIRLFLGKKAYQIAGQESLESSRKEWLQKVAVKILKRVIEIDSNTRHQEMLTMQAEKLLKLLKARKLSPWEIIYCLLGLCGRLLGFDFISGSILHTPIYHQSNAQHYTAKILDGGDGMQSYHDQKNIISIRKDVIEQLKKDGVSDFFISLVLNTSEYQIKKLRKGL